MSLLNASGSGTGFRNINPIHAALWILVLGLLLMIYLRCGGKLPWRPSLTSAPSPSPSPTQAPLMPRSLEPTLLASLNQKFYYFVPEKKAIFEHTPKTNTTVKLLDASFVISKIYSSSNQKRLAVLASDEKTSYSIYLIDLPLSAKQGRLPEIVIPSSLPPGYTLQPESTILWSPKNTQIAFTAYKDTRPDLFVVSLAISNKKPQQLRVLGEDLKNIVWVDDQSLAFTVRINGTVTKYQTKSNGADMVPIQDLN